MNNFDKQATKLIKEYTEQEEFLSDAEYLDEYTEHRPEFEVDIPRSIPGSNGEYTKQVLVHDTDGVEIAVIDCMFSLDDSLISCKPNNGYGADDVEDAYADKFTRILQNR